MCNVFDRLTRSSHDHTGARTEGEVRGINDTITEFNLEVPMQRMQISQVPRSQVDAIIDDVKSKSQGH